MRQRIILALLAITALGACGEATPGERTGQADAARGVEAAATANVGSTAAEAGPVVVYKSPTCGCCNGWIEHLEAEGFEVQGVDVDTGTELYARKAEAGVPSGLESCHTATVDGYTVEGHVPGEVVARLLRERPEGIVGIAVAGMPIGSPGMEGPDPEPYQVIAFDADGNRRVYATIDPR